MAAIDKLYVHHFYEYDDLKRWAIAYYPELLFYFYRIDISYKEWDENCRAYVKQSLKLAKRDFEKLSNFNNKEEAINNLRKHYYDTAKYECPREQAESELEYILDSYARKPEDWEEKYSAPILNIPLKVDRKLVWICPVPCVRKYLETHCGIKTRWYHKIFWKGRKHYEQKQKETSFFSLVFWS